MHIYKNEEKFWPTELQKLLLQACLLEDKHAFEAWEEWIAKADVDHLDQGSFRLIPLLYKRLRGMGVRKKIMNLFAGIYRMAWYKNRTLLYTATQVIQSMNNVGIQSLLLKGGSHSMLYYKDFGVRPMWDVDIMVKTEQAIEAHELIECLGWQPIDRPINAHMLYRHASGYRDAKGNELDLHWHLLHECCDNAADSIFWAQAQKVELYNTPFYVLSATDQLFHVCVHGAKWSNVPSFRWVPDAMTIINNTEHSVSWQRLIELARKRYLLLRLREALSYLKRYFNADIPDDILTEFYMIKPTRFEQIDNKYNRRSNLRSVIGRFLLILLQYYRIVNGLSWFQKMAEFPSYITYKYNLKHKRQIPRHVIRKVIKVLKIREC